MAETTDTPQDTHDKATQENVLPRRGLTLLGTMINDEAPIALLRVRPGDIRRVSPGDQVGTALVIAIEPGIVHLARGGASQRLSMPQG
ncbi:amidophosphoribosyltransferase [Roseovarius sp. 2305UL8-3]|uniref:amidophosphoribosyltransferase n=1 Tax=Roseovarius conchicola TaxID=3121636 RepID=UPI003527B9D8